MSNVETQLHIIVATGTLAKADALVRIAGDTARVHRALPLFSEGFFKEHAPTTHSAGARTFHMAEQKMLATLFRLDSGVVLSEAHTRAGNPEDVYHEVFIATVDTVREVDMSGDGSFKQVLVFEQATHGNERKWIEEVAMVQSGSPVRDVATLHLAHLTDADRRAHGQVRMKSQMADFTREDVAQYVAVEGFEAITAIAGGFSAYRGWGPQYFNSQAPLSMEMRTNGGEWIAGAFHPHFGEVLREEKQGYIFAAPVLPYLLEQLADVRYHR